MFRSLKLSALAALLILSLPVGNVDGRGRGGGGGGRSVGGGGGFSGGQRSSSNFGGGGFSGGGMSGGQRGPSNFGGGGMSGGQRGPSNFGGGGFSGGQRSPGNIGGSGNFGGGINSRPSQGPNNFGSAGRSGLASPQTSGLRPNTAGAGRAGGGIPASGNRATEAGRNDLSRGSYSRPSSNQLGNFLGMPSDGGMHGVAAGGRTRPSQLTEAGGKFDVNTGTATGPRGGQAAGATITGPQGNTAGKAVGVGADGGVAKVGGVRGANGNSAARGAAIGPDGGAAVIGGVQGADGGKAVRGAAVGSDGRAGAGRAAVGPGGFGGGAAVAAGPDGVAAGFSRVSPSGRYTTAAAVRTNYDQWNVYGDRWHVDHPGAWFAAGWATGAAWRAATWNSVGTWMTYDSVAPIYYDYGNTVTTDGGYVYVDGESAGTTQEYFQQASDLAAAGADAEAPADGDWLPLGVFALTKEDHETSVVSIELAVNKEGIIRGNYTDTKTGKTQLVQGSVDKETQRVAFSVGDNTSNFIETGLYNLTKDESPALIYVGKEKTEQWLLVRLEQPQAPTS